MDKMYSITQRDLDALKSLARKLSRAGQIITSRSIRTITDSVREIPQTLVSMLQEEPTPLMPLKKE